jgi:hypothetical protein
MTIRRLAPAVAVLALAGLAVGCSEYNDERGIGDAPIGERLEEPRDVYVMPDQFANVVAFCDGNTRIYVTTREAPVTAVADHPACRG